MKIHFFITTICLVAACELYSQQNNAAPEILIPYRYKKLWGYCDTLGRIKIAPEYDKVEFLNDGIHLPVTKNKKKTILDAGGKPVIGYYDNYGSLEIGAGYGVLNKYGLLETGAYRWVLNNGKAGVIGVNGDTALPIVYDKLFYSKSTSEYRSGKAALIGKIANRYFLISFYDKYRNLLPRPETTEIPALQTDPLVLWQNDAAPGFPPEAEPLFDAEQASYALTTERQQSIRQNLHVDSIENSFSDTGNR